MSKKNSTAKELIKFILVAPFLLALFVVIAGISPVRYNFIAVYINAGFALILYFARIIQLAFQNKKPKLAWIGRYLVQITALPMMAGVAALNMIYASLPSWHWIVPLAIMYPIAAVLPLFNEKLSDKLHDEAYAPSSRLGQVIVFSLLAIAPIAGVFGTFLSGISKRAGNGVIGYSILGFLLHFPFIWAEVTMAHTAWEEKPNKRKRR